MPWNECSLGWYLLVTWAQRTLPRWSLNLWYNSIKKDIWLKRYNRAWLWRAANSSQIKWLESHCHVPGYRDKPRCRIVIQPDGTTWCIYHLHGNASTFRALGAISISIWRLLCIGMAKKNKTDNPVSGKFYIKTAPRHRMLLYAVFRKTVRGFWTASWDSEDYFRLVIYHMTSLYWVLKYLMNVTH